MSANFVKLYSVGSIADSAFFLNDGQVYYYVSDSDKYLVSGKNLIMGTTEILMKNLLGTETGRIETAVVDKECKIKRMPVEKLIEGLNTYSISLNVSMVLAKQVMLSNRIINKNLDLLEGDEKKTREYSIRYYKILDKIKEEYVKRKLPWLKDILKNFEANLTYKRGEAYFKSAEPTRITTTANLADKTVEFKRGDIICEENSIGNEMYILQSGAIDVIINGNKVASIEESGTAIGEMALLLGEKRTATLAAKNNVVVSVIKKHELKDVAEKQKEVLTGIALSLAKRHYYNIIKIGNINKSIIDQSLTEEELGGKKVPQSEKALKDLNALKKEVNRVIKEKKPDFLDGVADD